MKHPPDPLARRIQAQPATTPSPLDSARELRSEIDARTARLRGRYDDALYDVARKLRSAWAARSAPPPPRSERVALPAFASIDASIVVPVYGKSAFTAACLRAIARFTDGPTYEVIVVDDASPDDTQEVLARFDNVRVHQNAKNLGFIGSCNAGAALARGRHLVFLNNDTEVTAGWLRTLVATADASPDVGLVGSKLVYPDGRLQEAGGVVFADGSAANFGRLDRPDRPAYEYERDVDYCSGASLLVPRALFERLSGFDTRYAPAYYEDTDLAFRVREAGKRVVYQPRSVVVHFEGVTSGKDLASGVKRYQVDNQVTFAARWQSVLARQPAAGTPLDLAKDRAPRGRVLVIDAAVPTPDRDSGSLRMTRVLETLRGLGWAVSFSSTDCTTPADEPERHRYLEELGIHVVRRPHARSIRAHLLEHGARYDVVVLSRRDVAVAHLASVRRHAPRAKVVFDTVDLHFLRERREAELRGSNALATVAARTHDVELDLVRRVDCTLVVSNSEREILERELPDATVRVLSNIHDVELEADADPRGRDAIAFIGSFRHPPNVDAVLWLVRDIMPRVWAKTPGVPLLLVGADAPAEVRALAEPRVEVLGHVDDLRPLLARTRVSVAPLRFGAGVKGKVNTSMSHGVPVVATTIAAEGMHLVDGVDVALADAPDAFADAVVALAADDERWLRLSVAGKANVRRHFSKDRAREALLDVEKLLFPG